MKQSQRLLIAGFIVPLGVILDQWTKLMVLNEPRFNALGCLENPAFCGRVEVSWLFDFNMLWNKGMSYGLFQSTGIMRWVLVGVAVVIATGFSVWLWRAGHWLTVTALSFVVSGAIGNLIDRVRFGAVVDFIDVSGFIPFFPYVFNVADSAVTVGAILLLFDQFILSRDETESNTLK